MKPRKTKQEFVSQAAQKHNYKYDYSFVVYKNAHIPIMIICPDHGLFFQRPYSHLRGLGCRACKIRNMFLSHKQFIERAQAVHGDTYDYSQVVYDHSHRKVKIICPTHGAFTQTPNAHIGGKQGCKKCHSIYRQKVRWDFSNPIVRKTPATVYLSQMVVNNAVYNKIGVTKRSVKKRHAGTQHNVLWTYNTTLYDAYQIEQQLLEQFNDCRLQDLPAVKFNGWPEVIQEDAAVLQQALQRLTE